MMESCRVVWDFQPSDTTRASVVSFAFRHEHDTTMPDITLTRHGHDTDDGGIWYEHTEKNKLN